jgi:hypothetical protein
MRPGNSALPVEPSAAEAAILKRIIRRAKLFVFLRQPNHGRRAFASPKATATTCQLNGEPVAARALLPPEVE